MKKRPTRETTKPSAIPETNSAILAPGTFPVKPASATAEVLLRLLSGERVTAADALEFASTMRAGACVHYLRERYDWPIEAAPRAAGCADGRLARIAEYVLPQQVIHAARAAGAGRWLAEVRKARAALRARAAQAYRQAARINRALKAAARKNPNQGDFFGEGEL